MKVTKSHIDWVLSVYIAFVFVQSLFFKFTGSVETAHIFNTLDAWAAGFGLGGVFSPRGIFSQYVVGSAELVASALLCAGLLMKRPLLHALGALLGMGVISGAIFFHLFTPLGIEVLGDGGLLFFMACGIWLACAFILWMNKDLLLAVITGGLEKQKSA